jgi:hypothetical protein
MDVVITQYFEVLLKKYRGKWNIDIEDFADMIAQSALKNTIYLRRPIAKLKFSYEWKAIRLIILVKEDTDTIIPLYITDKNDKVIGDNMTRESIKKSIDLHIQKTQLCIKEWLFITY